MIITVAELAPSIMAMAISSTTRCANASDLHAALAHHPQCPIRKDFHKKSRWNFTCGSRHDPLAMCAWFEIEKETFFVVSLGSLSYKIAGGIAPGEWARFGS